MDRAEAAFEGNNTTLNAILSTVQAIQQDNNKAGKAPRDKSACAQPYEKSSYTSVKDRHAWKANSPQDYYNPTHTDEYITDGESASKTDTITETIEPDYT